MIVQCVRIQFRIWVTYSKKTGKKRERTRERESERMRERVAGDTVVKCLPTEFMYI